MPRKIDGLIFDTVVMKKPKARCIQDKVCGSTIALAAAPSPKPGINNILISFMDDDLNKVDQGTTIIIDYEDSTELVGTMLDLVNGDDITSSYEFKTRLAPAVSFDYEIEMEKSGDDRLKLVYTGKNKDNNEKIELMLSYNALHSVSQELLKVCDDQLVFRRADTRLNEIMTSLKDDMKAERIKELHFSMYDSKPELYSSMYKNMMKLIEIIPYGYDDQPIGYSFLRYMHLTGALAVDFRTYGKEFLCCPFVYDDELIKLGSGFVENKQNELKEFIDGKIKNH